MFDRKRFVLVLSIAAGERLNERLPAGAGEEVRRRGQSLPRGLPMEISGWQGSPFSAAMPREVGPEDYILRSYEKGRRPAGGHAGPVQPHFRITIRLRFVIRGPVNS